MGVRVPGVVMIDRAPLELTPEVHLHLLHEPPHVGAQVELPSVLGRDDDPELMLLPRARLLEALGVQRSVRPIELSPRSVLLDPVALDVPQVQPRGLDTPSAEPRYVRLDDDAPQAFVEASRHTSRPAAPPSHANPTQQGEDTVAKPSRLGPRPLSAASSDARSKSCAIFEKVHA